MSFARSFPGFSLRLTRWGGLFLVACLALGFAAVNTSNNALMALLGLALGSYVVSGTWSRQVLAAARLDLVSPREVFAQRPTTVEVDLRNTSRIFAAYGVVVRDGSGRVLLFEPMVEAGGRRRRTVEVSFPRRGLVDLQEWRIEVLLPLGFFLKSKRVGGGQKMLVYPALRRSSSRLSAGGGGRRAALGRVSRGREGDVTQLRDFREGDEARQVHWKQTARQRRLIATERERAADEAVLLILDRRLAAGDGADGRERFEALVSEVAAVIVQRLTRGLPVGLVMGAETFGPVSETGQMGHLLAPLATVEPLPDHGEPPVPVRGSATLLFSLLGER